VLCVPTDATKLEDCQELVRRSVEAFGGLDLLVYCVGQAMHVLFHEITDIARGARALLSRVKRR
jgi:NAD(P)-dependent dehydrogenase (short-subunit alcohol dehydrogenase family)